MSTSEFQQSYRAHGAFTDPGARGASFAGLPTDVAGLCRIIQGVLIHLESGTQLYGAMSRADDPPSRATLPVGVRLAAIGSLTPRPAADRAVGTCRDFALMLCAMLRHQGVPARVRCGFAAYFEPGFWEDHWVCEYWHAAAQRWALADAQLDEAHRRHLAIDFDPSDLPADRFLLASQAWRRFRAGAEGTLFGHGDATGAWFLHVNLARDLLALGKQEVSAWDRWRECGLRSRHKRLDAAAIAICDALAHSTEMVDHAPVCPSVIARPFWLARASAG